MNMLKKSVMAAVCAVALAGCQSQADSAEAAKMEAHKKCVSYGYADYTESYKSCVKSFMDNYEKETSERMRLIEQTSHAHMR